MKSLYLTFTDKDFKKIKKVKDKSSDIWETFIYNVVMRYGKQKD